LFCLPLKVEESLFLDDNLMIHGLDGDSFNPDTVEAVIIGFSRSISARGFVLS